MHKYCFYGIFRGILIFPEYRFVKKFLQHLLKIIIIVLLFITAFGLVFFVSWKNSISLQEYGIIGIIVLIESIFVLVLIQFFYEWPIQKLEFTIKKFLLGSLKDKDIVFQETMNPHLNFVLKFFAKTLGTLKNIKSEFLHGKEIKWEVALAGEIQGKLLGKKLPEVPDLEIIARSKPAGEIGWDSYDVISEKNNHYIYVWDATGHGVGAGFIMMMVNSLVSAYAKVTHKWNHILALTNDIIKPRVKANLLMSMLLVRWDAKNKRMYMTGAGHEYLMIYKHAKKKCFSLKSGWVALWMTKNIHKLLKEQEISFEPNDVLILYSDGITEAIDKPKRDGSEEMFGERLLISAIEDAPDIGTNKIKTARSIFKNISIQLSKFMGYKYIQLDDITLATVQYVSPEYNKDEDCTEEMESDFVTEWKW